MADKNRRKRTALALLAAVCITAGGCGSKEAPASDSQSPARETEAQDSEVPAALEQDNAAEEAGTGNEIPPEQPDPAALTEESSPASDEAITGEVHTIVGIITDATAYSIAIQVPEGDIYYLSIPDSGVGGNLNSITIGQIVTLSYRGSLDESHAALVGISDSSLVTGIYVEEYAFAIKIMNAVRNMDMKGLSDLTNFPVFLETGDFSSDIGTSGEFEAIALEKIFTEALTKRIANYNLFDLEYTDAGFVMGKGTPSITFDVDDDGILGIIGINCNPAPDTTNKD